MRRAAVLLAIIALLAAPAAVLAQEDVFFFEANLEDEQEVPAPTVPDDYAGFGEAAVTISDDETEIEYSVDYEGLTGDLQASHIHYGAVGVAGGVILPLDIGTPGTSGSYSGTLTEADFTPVDGGPQTFAEALKAMRAGNTYINLHTAANSAGELRGQLGEGGIQDPDTLPPTSTAEQPVSGAPPWTMLLLALGLVALLFVVRRFAARLG